MGKNHTAVMYTLTVSGVISVIVIILIYTFNLLDIWTYQMHRKKNL